MESRRRYPPPDVPGLIFNRGGKPMVTSGCVSTPYGEHDWVEVTVPMESNGKEYSEDCVVRFRRCTYHDSWEFEVSDALLRQNIQGIHAVLGLALAELGSMLK